MLYHPGIASLPCAKCAAMMHNMETGEVEIRYRGAKREPYNLTAENSGWKAPCRTGWKCPKGTPETAHEHELSRRNWRTWLLYQQAKGTGFQFMPAVDALLADNFAIIHNITTEFERHEHELAATRGMVRTVALMRR